MERTECPMCGHDVCLDGRKERDIIECVDCGAKLEVVSRSPVVLEISPEADEEWE